MQSGDFPDLIKICERVYPDDDPYTFGQLENHLRRFPEGQLVAEHQSTGRVVGAHFTLRICFSDFHIDDPWNVLTADGTFEDDNPAGHTLYGADIMISPDHQHHGLGGSLTTAAKAITQQLHLWRMVGGSRLPGYGKVSREMDVHEYVQGVVEGRLVDPVLTVHLKDGWSVVRPIQNYLQHDPESSGWSAVIQWVNPESTIPSEFNLN